MPTKSAGLSAVPGWVGWEKRIAPLSRALCGLWLVCVCDRAAAGIRACAERVRAFVPIIIAIANSTARPLSRKNRRSNETIRARFYQHKISILVISNHHHFPIMALPTPIFLLAFPHEGMGDGAITSSHQQSLSQCRRQAQEDTRPLHSGEGCPPPPWHILRCPPG